MDAFVVLEVHVCTSFAVRRLSAVRPTSDIIDVSIDMADRCREGIEAEHNGCGSSRVISHKDYHLTFQVRVGVARQAQAQGG